MRHIKAMLVLLMPVFFLVWFVLTSLGAKSAEPASAADPGLAPEKKVEIILNEKEFAEVEYEARPFVESDIVNLVPNEKVFVQAEMRKGKIVRLRHVAVNENPERTIEIEFTQNQDRKRPFMTLSVKNPFENELTYDANIQDFGKEDFRKTSTLAVPPQMMNVESWPTPLSRIVLNNFQLEKKRKPKTLRWLSK